MSSSLARSLISLPIYYPPIFYLTLFLITQDDGTDIEFRNVGFYTSDAGEIPKRTQTTNLSWCLQLLDCNILNLEDFDVSLLIKTKGKVCHVILNTVSGPEISRTVRSLAEFGHCIQLVQADTTRNKSIGKTKNDSMCLFSY